MNDPPHILVVDDERRIRTILRRYLTDEGYRISEAADGQAMRAVLERETVTLILLDVNMPGEDGLTLARELRRHSEIPIIMLTGKGDLVDRVAGLETGADDYITKPFELREVLARIRTVMRRADRRSTSTAITSINAGNAGILVFDGWRLDLPRRELLNPTGNAVSLTAGEFDLLRVFARHPNRVLSRDQLMDLVKGREWSAYDRAIDTQIVRLRYKIERDPGQPTLIKTVRGSGYIFAAAVTVG
jgi:two-component system phosphate regulon response regulator OmpR